MEQKFYTVEDVMKILNYQHTKAYTVIRELNQELESKGIKTVKGRVLKSYFNKTFGVEE